MAKEKGFYKDVGIDVNILEGGPDKNVYDIVMSGKADIGIISVDILEHMANGSDSVIICPIIQHSIKVLFTKKIKDLNNLKNLLGKKLALNLNELEEFDAMFKTAGVDFDLLDIKNKNKNTLQDFINGKIFAFNGSDANQRYILEKNKIEFDVIKPINFGIDFYGDSIFTSLKLVKKNLQLVNDFKEASIKGWYYAFNNPEECLELIISKYNSEKTKEHLWYEYNKILQYTSPKLIQIGHSNPERWNHIIETYKKLGIIKNDFSVNRYLLEYYNNKNIIYLKYCMYCITIVIILFSIIIIWNLMLKKKVHLQVKDIRKYKEFIEVIINSMPIYLVGINEKFEITFCNNKMKELNSNGDKYIGEYFFQMFPNIPVDKNNIIEVIENNNSKYIFNIKIKKDQVEFYGDLTIFPIRKNSFKGVVIIITDNSERKKIDEFIIQTEKMISLGGVSAGMAHEINNPLAGISASLNNIEKRLDMNLDNNLIAASEIGIDPDKINMYLFERRIFNFISMMKISILKASNIVKNMLSFAGNMERVEKTENDIPEILNSSIDFLKVYFDVNSGFDFEKILIDKYYEENLPKVLCSPEKLQQVFINILKNGSEAMWEKEYENGDKPKFNIVVSGNDRYVNIVIRDNGIGIAEEISKNVFDPFYTTKSTVQGNGLGLSVSYFIITKQHLGEIRVESKKGEYTEFIIDLPI